MTSGSGCNLWMWLVSVVVGRYIYRFPHITYPYSSCICSFLQQHPYFLFIFKMFFIYMSKLKRTLNAHNFKIKTTPLQRFDTELIIHADSVYFVLLFIL